jgi:hypothetical protein
MPFPGLSVTAVEEVEFLAPFKFYRDEPRTITVEAVFSADGDAVVAHCTLAGTRMLPGQDGPQRTEHFRGVVRLGDTASEPEKGEPAGAPEGATVHRDAVYALFFHGPAYQVMAEAWGAGGTVVGCMADDLPPNQVPEDPLPLFAPRLIELCFQTAGIWEMASAARMGLPARIERVTVAAADGSAPLCAVVTPEGDGGFAARVVDDAGRTLVTLEGYRTAALPAPLDDGLVAPLRSAITAS